MVQERAVVTPVELVHVVTAAPGDVTDLAVTSLRAAVNRQGLHPRATSVVSAPGTDRLRELLAEVLAGSGAEEAEEPAFGDGGQPSPATSGTRAAVREGGHAAPPPSGEAGAVPAGSGQPAAVALVAADLVVNAPPLGALLDDPRVRTGALAQPRDGHQVHVGALVIAPEHRLTAAALLRRPRPATASSAAPSQPPPAASGSGPDGEAGDVLLELTRGLVAEGVEVRPVPVGGYLWARPATIEQAREAVAAVDAVDERTVRLREAARGGDGFFSTFVLRKASWRLTGVAERLGVTPNQVTLASFGLGLVAAGMLAVGDRTWSVAGALLLQLCLVVDCVDGELARYRRRFSRFGAWLDATTDRVKEFAAIGALAVAAGRHGMDLWPLVIAAIGVQTFRNLLDLGWSMQRGPAAPAPAVAWVAATDRVPAPPRPRPGEGAGTWLRRVGHFPVGERFLLISLGAALATPEITLLALLAFGLLAAGYMLAAFAVRSRPAPSPAATRRALAVVDSGPYLGALLARPAGDRGAAVLPAVVALAELFVAGTLAALTGGDWAAAALLVAAVSIAHYQHGYGVREDGSAAGGWSPGTDLRLVALLAVVLGAALTPDPADWARYGVLALAAVVALTSTVRSLRVWTSPVPDASATGAGRTGGGSSEPGDGASRGAIEQDSTDRMQTVNAGTDGTVRTTAGRLR